MRELSLNIMDIAQNSIAAKATLIQIELLYNTGQNLLNIRVEDNGCGMSAEQLKNVQSPFFTTRTTRKIGLGVPLFKMACEMTGGEFHIHSTPGKGTLVSAIFHTDHIDMVPMGDINGTILLLVTCNPDIDFIFRKQLNQHEMVLDTRQLREVLGDEVSLGNPDVVEWIRDYLKEQQQILSSRANQA